MKAKMSEKLRKFKVLNTTSGYSHKLSRKCSLLAFHERLSTENLKTLQIFAIAKAFLEKVLTIKIYLL